MSPTLEKITEIIEPYIMEMGYSLVKVAIEKEDKRNVLVVYIDKSDGVNMQDCVLVTKKIKPILDEKEVIPDSYFISVSSVGINV